MKIHIEVDCTPEEARRFFGLPDVAPMQEVILKDLQKRLAEAIAAADTGKLLEQWMPLGLKGIEQWQEFWTRLAGAAAGAGGERGGAESGGEAGGGRAGGKKKG